jgi:8-oxo-dGTP pyrophosphatase MutT (NUDIX family)
MPKLETARIMLIDPYRETYLVERLFDANQRPSQLDFLGGQVEKGESAFAAALREVRQEGFIDLTDTTVEHVMTWRDEDGQLDITRDYYMAEVDSFPTRISDEHIGSVVLPAAMAYDALAPFLPHQAAFDMALRRL